jgi:hypothetical protein
MINTTRQYYLDLIDGLVRGGMVFELPPELQPEKPQPIELPAPPVELPTQPAALVTTKPAASFWLLVAAGLIFINQ